MATGQTLTLGGTLTRTTGNALVVQGGAGTVAASAITNTNGIIGPWALVNTGGLYSYATVTGGNIVAYTGGTAVNNAAAAYGGIPSGGTGTINYDIGANGTLAATGLGRSVNTLRYTGSARRRYPTRVPPTTA